MTQLNATERQLMAYQSLQAQISNLSKTETLSPNAMPQHSGLDSVLVKVKSTQSNYILKTYRRGALAPYTFKGASIAYQTASDAGIGPLFKLGDYDTKTLLIEDLSNDYRGVVSSDVTNITFMETLLILKKRWHMEGHAIHHFTPLSVFEELLEQWRRSLSPLPLPASPALDINELYEWMQRIDDSLSASGRDARVLHGENALSNVMIDSHGHLCLLDFDRASVGDPFWDLGSLALEVCTDDHDRNRLLELYFGHARPSDLARLKLYSLADDILWAIWSFLGEIAIDRKGPELYKYGANRLVRFRYHLNNFDFPRIAREV